MKAWETVYQHPKTIGSSPVEPPQMTAGLQKQITCTVVAVCVYAMEITQHSGSIKHATKKKKLPSRIIQ